jgi:hypothetical protein
MAIGVISGVTPSPVASCLVIASLMSGLHSGSMPPLMVARMSRGQSLKGDFRACA